MNRITSPPPAPLADDRPPRGVLRTTVEAAIRLPSIWIGLAILLGLLFLALLGPHFARLAPDEVASDLPFATDGYGLFGLDHESRQVWSRFLWGGRSVFGLSAAATAIGIGFGSLLGLLAAYSRGRVDAALMWVTDVVLAFPPILLVLVSVSTVGPSVGLLIITVGITNIPRATRVVRGAALQVVDRDFVRASEALGESRLRIMFGELLPNVVSPLVVEATLRFAYTVAIVAGVSFLGYGLQPPAADWGVMVNENYQGVQDNPWATVLPVAAIGLLTIGAGLVGDGLSRALARIGSGDGSS